MDDLPLHTELPLTYDTAMKQNLKIAHDDEAKRWELKFSLIGDPTKVDVLGFEVGKEFDEKMPLGFIHKGRKSRFILT